MIAYSFYTLVVVILFVCFTEAVVLQCETTAFAIYNAAVEQKNTIIIEFTQI